MLLLIKVNYIFLTIILFHFSSREEQFYQPTEFIVPTIWTALRRIYTSISNSTSTDLSSNIIMSNSDAQKTTAGISLSLNDPNSFSNPEDILVENHDIRWTIDFDRSILFGSVKYRLKWINTHVTQLKLDTHDLEIKSIINVKSGTKLKYNIGESYLNFGKPLIIDLPKEDVNSSSSLELDIQIEYETKPCCSALLWLPKEQTNGKEFPYLFSQCQAIHARSVLPCQDTPFVKSTYTAEVFAPSELTVLMSAVRNNCNESASSTISTTADSKLKLHKFIQKVPIPSYLLAIAVGKLNGKQIGPRTTIWSEQAFVEKAAFDFSDTEEFIKTAENLVGPYLWGVYDILVLPPSFPYGGMENPCLTFVTPTLLAGDKSLADVVAHEISHSWTGNLVTNKNWEHFWLNEGFTMFLERKIAGRIHGEPFRQLQSIGGYKALKEAVATFGADNPLTNLVVDLNGVDPDDAFSSVPYEKGYLFLYYLEQTVGGPAVFEKFFKEYIQSHKYQSIDSNTFKAFFIGYFTNLGKVDDIKDIDWDAWYYQHGMPTYVPKYDTSLADACTLLKDRWFKWNPSSEPNPFQASDLDGLKLRSPQIINFLDQILDSCETLNLEKVQAMENVYNFNAVQNCEILFRWLRISIKAKWSDQIPIALKFVTDQNRMKYIRPIYRDLYANEDYRQQAIETFKSNREFMMHVSAYAVEKDLGLRE